MLALCLLVALAASTGWSSSAGALQAVRTDRRSAEEELELFKLTRRFPPEPSAEQEQELLAKLAEGSGLTDVVVRTATGPGPVLSAELASWSATARVHELVATGDELAAVLFPARLRALTRPTLVDGLEITSRGPREVLLVARIAFPALDPFSAGLEKTRALLDRVDEPPRPTAALLRIADEIAELPVGITRLSWGRALTLEAIAGGRRAAADFESALRELGIRELELTRVARGGCLALIATGALGETTEALEDELSRESFPTEIFWSESESLCASDEGTPFLAARQPGEADEEGTTLRLRSARRGDALLLLEQATGHPWLGFGEPEPRLDLDLAGPSLDRTIAALEAAGAPLRRFGESVLWTESTTEREPDLPYEGEPISIAVRCAEIPILLRIFEQITGLELVAAPGVDGCVDAFATDRPWDELFEASLVAANLDYRVDGTTVHVAPASPGAASSAARGSLFPRWRSPLERIETTELRLFGLLRDGEAWRAFAEGPLGQRYELSPGAALADALVESVDASGVTLIREAGAIRLDLP